MAELELIFYEPPSSSNVQDIKQTIASSVPSPAGFQTIQVSSRCMQVASMLLVKMGRKGSSFAC